MSGGQPTRRFGTGSRQRHDVVLTRHHEEVMGTVVVLELYTVPEQAGLTELLSRACARLHEADDVISTWQEASPMSRLRRGDITLEQAPPEIARVLERCEMARTLTHGWFDPWAMPGGVDPTGLVKGWAAERALEVLRAPTVIGAMVNAAGDIAAFGGPSTSAPFRVGIVDPAERGQLACVVQLAGAIATSGTYERGAHLVDPHTGRGAARLASASVCGPDLGLADAFATALAVAGQPGLAFVEAAEGYEALAIGHDGRWQWTPGFPFAPPSPVPPDRPARMSPA